MEYLTRTIEIPNIDTSLRHTMASIYFSHYDGSDTPLFFRDLEEKQEAILLYFDNKLVGFTTWLSFDYSWNNKATKIIFSGDTIVDRAHWGQQALAFAWIKRMAQVKLSSPHIPLYWFLLVKGHRTYKYLPAFALSWYPHWSMARDDLKDLADQLAIARYGSLYDTQCGIVQFPESMGHLKNDIAFPTEKELANPAVHYFLKKNPSFHHGDELVCICEISPENMRTITRRIFYKVKESEFPDMVPDNHE